MSMFSIKACTISNLLAIDQQDCTSKPANVIGGSKCASLDKAEYACMISAYSELTAQQIL